jgi:hypothetical protein
VIVDGRRQHVVPRHEESAAVQGDALSGEGPVQRNLQCIHGNRLAAPMVAPIRRCQVASFLGRLARRVIRRAARRLSATEVGT